MNKFFYIGGIVFSIAFMIVTAYYSAEVSAARFQVLFNELLPSYLILDTYSSLTQEMAWISLLFLLFFLAMHILGLLKVKTRTTKALSIIGIVFSFLLIVWDLIMLSEPGAISFDEVSPAWILYGLIALAFSIIGLIQSVRYARIRKRPQPIGQSDILDSPFS